MQPADGEPPERDLQVPATPTATSTSSSRLWRCPGTCRAKPTAWGTLLPQPLAARILTAGPAVTPATRAQRWAAIIWHRFITVRHGFL